MHHNPTYIRFLILMRRIRKLLFAKLNFFAHPLEWLVKKFGPIKARYIKLLTFMMGMVILLVGAFLATLKQNYMPHFVWDGLAYSVHGMGAAPIIKIIFDAIKIEV